MDTSTLKSILNKAIKENTLSLNSKIKGITWNLPASLKTYFKLKKIAILGDNLAAEDAKEGAVVVDGINKDSVLVSGKSSHDILNVPKERIQLSLYATPLKPNKPKDSTINFTLIAQILDESSSSSSSGKSFRNTSSSSATPCTGAWKPTCSFPLLSNSTLFKQLVAHEPPAFILSSFVHDQYWNLKPTKAGINFSNTFIGLEEGFFLQLPAGVPAPAVKAFSFLSIDASSKTFLFNGAIDNSKTDKNPDNLTIELWISLGKKYNRSLSANREVILGFDIGMKFVPNLPKPKRKIGKGSSSSSSSTPKFLTKYELQAKAGKATLKGEIDNNKHIIHFRMYKKEGGIALSLGDLLFLFDNSFLYLFLPDHLKQHSDKDSFLSNIGIVDFGMDIYMPPKPSSSTSGGSNNSKKAALYTNPIETSSSSSAKPSRFKVTSIYLEVAYKHPPGPVIGFQPWFDLQNIDVKWVVEKNPFPLSKAFPIVTFNGGYEFLAGKMEFTGSYAKEKIPSSSSAKKKKTLYLKETSSSSASPTTKWVFELDSQLKPTPKSSSSSGKSSSSGGSSSPAPKPNYIRLSSVFQKYSSHSQDIPDFDITALHFTVKPDKKFYYTHLELEEHWTLANFTKPVLKNLTLDITSVKQEKTGLLQTKISFVSKKPTYHPLKKRITADPRTVTFDFLAKRTRDAWTFKAFNDQPFTIGELADAFGFRHPDYLNEINIKTVSVEYIAPITKSSSSSAKSKYQGKSKSSSSSSSPKNEKYFKLEIEAIFPIGKENFDLKLDYIVAKDRWEFDATLFVSPKKSYFSTFNKKGSSSSSSAPEHKLEFDFSAQGKTISNSSSSGSTTKETIITAKLQDAGKKPLNISDFAAAFGAKRPNLPHALEDIELVEADFEYDTAPGRKGFLFYVESKNYGQLIFSLVKSTNSSSSAVNEPHSMVSIDHGYTSNGDWKPFFGFAFKPTIDFTKLPIIGKAIKKYGRAEMDGIQLAILTRPLTPSDIGEMNTLFKNIDPKDKKKLSKFIPDVKGTIPAEAIFNATLKLKNDKEKPINLVFKLGKSHSSSSGNQQLSILPTSEESIPQDSHKEKVEKSFGPVHIRDYNIVHSNGKVGLAFTGELTLAGIDLSFMGLDILMNFPPKGLEDVSFRLHGLGVEIKRGGLNVTGGLLSIGEEFNNYMGMVAVSTNSLGFQAYGGYSNSTPEPSFFIFVNLNMPIGGPPFFFVNGLSGGFGINRSFTLPSFDDLDSFPLLPNQSNNPIPVGPPENIDAITSALDNLAEYIKPEPGAYWVALGLSFKSFEIIQVSAILEVSFGVSFQVALLGSAAMGIPDPKEPLAFLQVDFLVEFVPAEGVLGVLGKITKASYIFSKDCHLSGGFAFYSWFSGDYQGDFVVTIGGYHPSFKKPDHYPTVPRVELHYDLGDLKLDGQSYFAMTPHLLMAGQSISATYESSHVKASFEAGFDFLVSWKPFSYDATAYIHISVEAHISKLHFSAHLGVDLHLWGPKFGGVAIINWHIISFTIGFGSDGPTIPSISWETFKTSLIANSYPATKPSQRLTVPTSHYQSVSTTDADQFAVSQVLLTKGLIQQMEPNPLSDKDILNNKINWLIDPNHFELTINSGVAVNNFWFNNNGQGRAVNARGEEGLIPSTGTGIYKLPEDYYTNGQELNEVTSTVFLYNFKALKSKDDYWWKKDLQVGAVGMDKGEFDSNGNWEKGFGSTLIFNFQKINKSKIVNESDIVIKLETQNVPNSLWGPPIIKRYRHQQLNQLPTIKHVLSGLTISPLLWHPKKTQEINIYLLLFESGNKVYWSPESSPTVRPNTFARTISEDGNTMTFQTNGSTITNKFRQLEEATYQALPSSQSIISDLNSKYGFDVELKADTTKLAKTIYKDWLILANLGEEDDNASNI